MAGSGIFPNQDLFVSIFGEVIEEKVEEYNESGYYSSNITSFSNYFLRKENEFLKNHQQEVERVDES